MADRAEKSRRDRREPHPLAVLAGVLAAFLLLAACYVGYQALHILFPQNVYETALPATVSDNVEADGVLLFDEVYVSGSGTLGYLPTASASRPGRLWRRSTAMLPKRCCASSSPS